MSPDDRFAAASSGDRPVNPLDRLRSGRGRLAVKPSPGTPLAALAAPRRAPRPATPRDTELPRSAPEQPPSTDSAAPSPGRTAGPVAAGPRGHRHRADGNDRTIRSAAPRERGVHRAAQRRQARWGWVVVVLALIAALAVCLAVFVG